MSEFTEILHVARKFDICLFTIYYPKCRVLKDFAMLSTRTSFAALTTEFAMQTRQPQSSFSFETAHSRNIVCAQTMLISKLEIKAKYFENARINLQVY